MKNRKNPEIFSTVFKSMKITVPKKRTITIPVKVQKRSRRGFSLNAAELYLSGYKVGNLIAASITGKKIINPPREA